MATEQLAATVYVTDPQTRQTVTLHPGTLPEPRLAALVTSKAAWVDGKLPRLPKTDRDPQNTATADDQDDASGAASETSGDGEEQAAPAAKKTAAKTTATRPARGRTAADKGNSGE